MSWRTVENYASHPGAPPVRNLMPPVTVNRATLARSRTIVTDNTGTVSDTGWGDWGSVAVGLGWISLGLASRFGSSWLKIECQLQVASGIGRPWKVLWRSKITDGTTFAVTYSGETEQLLLPGASLSILFDASEGTYLELGSGAALVPADGE